MKTAAESGLLGPGVDAGIGRVDRHHSGIVRKDLANRMGPRDGFPQAGPRITSGRDPGDAKMAM